ncbi:MAG: peptidoglycan DD-metalloendopeptidase family protein [Patescibacteria group bacterium]
MNFKFTQKKIIGLLILGSIFLFVSYFCVFAKNSLLNLKLPFSKGEKWTVTQGYYGSFSHYKKESIYSIDFNLSGRQDFGKPILAIAEGKVSLHEDLRCVRKVAEKCLKMEFHDYGKYIDIDHGDYISRYAHLLDFAVENGQYVKQGEIIGYCGSTGYSTGSHLHFAFFKKENGKIVPTAPEPISGYTNFEDEFARNKEYVSDNKLAENNSKETNNLEEKIVKENKTADKPVKEIIKEKPIEKVIAKKVDVLNTEIKKPDVELTQDKIQENNQLIPVIPAKPAPAKSNFIFVSNQTTIPLETETNNSSTATSTATSTAESTSTSTSTSTATSTAESTSTSTATSTAELTSTSTSTATSTAELTSTSTSTATSTAELTSTSTSTIATTTIESTATSTATSTPEILPNPDIDIWLGEDYAINSWQWTINWKSNDQELNYYQLQKKEGDNEWLDLLTQAKEEKTTFQINKDFSTYYFRVKAIAKDNRESDWKEISAPFASRPIIINEVMYHPTVDSYYVYIELYNLSSIDIDLSDWKLKIGETIENLELAKATSTIIKAGSFAIIGDKPSELSDKNIYDGFYSIECDLEKICLQLDNAAFGKNGLKNTGETIVLLNDKNKIIDQIKYVSSTNDAGKSLQKINPYSLSSHQNNFTLASSTPNQTNLNFNLSAPTYISKDYIISENTIFTSKANQYLLFSDTYNSPTLNASTTLLIELGVILKPQNKNTYGSGLVINGTLIAKGTKENPIKFTSPNNTPMEGDYNQALLFTPDSKNSILENVVFEYGDFMTFAEPMVSIFEAKVKISNSVFKNSLFSALLLVDSDSEIENSVFENNKGVAISIQGGGERNSKIKNCEFKKNQKGIEISGQTYSEISNNIFSENEKPVLMEIDSKMSFSNSNEMKNNSFNGILINSNEIEEGTSTLQIFNYPYIMEKSLSISEQAALILSPGVVIKSFGDFILFEVLGNLIAQGEEEKPIIITSLKDDQYLGDTNNDGENSYPAKGDWNKIEIFNKANLKNLKLRYGQESPLILKLGSEVIQENVFIEQ